MLRRYREHEIRRVWDLRGVWDFAFLGDREPDEVEVAGIEFGDRMGVPGCFDASPAYAGRRGLAAYRMGAWVPDGGKYRLILDGVHHWGRVYVNGEARGDHVGGFTRFGVDFEVGGAGEVEVAVLVDSRFDYERCPLHLAYFDWYHYGGIARGVELHRLGEVWIEGVRVVTEEYGGRKLLVVVEYGAKEGGGERELEVSFDGGEVIREGVKVSEGGGEIRRRVEVPEAGLWSPEQPNLHLVGVRLGEDDQRERVGIRQVRTEGQQILVNDEPVRLLGVNRHESHPQIGHGLPASMLVADAQLVRDLGCNFVRGAHYPQDIQWLDLCDEMGFMVWSEVLGWQHTAEHLTDPHFMQAQLTNLEEMVAAAFNHPSVIMYGILNESRSDDPDCRPGYERLLGRLRELDSTRLVTYTVTRPEKDLCLDLVDVIAVDCYPGWYNERPEDIPQYLDGIAETIDSRGFDDKPLMIAEIGAGAIWGWRDWHAGYWSEQYQVRLLETEMRHLLAEDSRWCGMTIWQLCDCRTSEATGRALGRPRNFNNKGVVDEYRRPKMAYELVRSYYRRARDASKERR